METALAPSQPPPAGFWIRFVVVLIDTVVFVVAEVLLRLFSRGLWGSAVVDSAMFPTVMFVFILVFDAVYTVTLHALFGQTVGKMFLHVRVVRVDGRPLSWRVAVVRYVGEWISLVLLGAGYLMVGIRRDKRGLHDFFAGTRVIKTV